MNKGLFNDKIDPKFPIVVETYMPPDYAPDSSFRKKLEREFADTNLENLIKIPLPAGGNRVKSPKNEVIKTLVSAFHFENKKKFEDWFSIFPPVSQRILAGLAVYKHILIEQYEKDSDIKLVLSEKFSRYTTRLLNPKLNLNFLDPFSFNGSFGLSVMEPLLTVLRIWLCPPKEALLDKAAVTVEDGTEVFSNAVDISVTWPLLCETLSENIKQIKEKATVKTLPKKLLTDIRSKCGFKTFPLQKDIAPDALDMAACFVLYMSDFKPKRPEDGQTGVKEMVETFFGINDAEHNIPHWTHKWELLEYNLLTNHIKRPGSDWMNYDKPPPSRFAFYRMLKMIALDKRWFKADALALCYQYTENQIEFSSRGAESNMYIKCSSVLIDNLKYESDYGEGRVYVEKATRYAILVEPLFKAYCYLLAALGLLEITQKDPELRITSMGKQKPLSIYDSLDAVRITSFGRWCLGLDAERPERMEENYEAIADKELLLVTVRGTSYERTFFLDAIGEKLGDDRWRISPQSFISNCTTEKDIKLRIEKFKRLIDPKPLPHWERLFSRALDRAGWMRKNTMPAKVYTIGKDLDFAEELLKDPDMAACIFRAEGRLIVVPNSAERRFIELMAEHGSMNER
ncbi:MAG: hypothetical protein LBD20_06500 [Spirochaetaceae bacterium]|jgi:hypothetical protein|nr:hypothetical protein [Spirochaetaceae bacterium]